ncbi:MAG TPA: hypothetical protein VEV13_02605 [Candidatus Limnocylindria bacterium]|nr:hypothetical protein [Candidatus Limnocylindria bacterium]
MKELAADPDSTRLRAELDVGDDVIDPQIRQVELRNWLRFVDSRPGSSQRHDAVVARAGGSAQR